MELKIPLGNHFVEGVLEAPHDSFGLVLFVHGSGSSRLSPRNQSVARFLQKGGLGTLLFDLLTHEEELFDEQTSELRFNIPLLTERLLCVVRFARMKFSRMPIGYFGASTGAAAALCAAAIDPEAVQAVVSRGGRPDLAESFLPKVEAPTLFLVGSLDPLVIELNKQAFSRLVCKKKLTIIEGATHLFEEPGKLQLVSDAALDWFKEAFNSSTRRSR